MVAADSARPLCSRQYTREENKKVKRVRKTALVFWVSLVILAPWCPNIALSQGQNQRSQDATGRQQDKSLKERPVLTKPEKTTVRDKDRADVIIVKFREGTRIRFGADRLVVNQGIRSTAEQRLLDRANLDATKVDTDLESINFLLQKNPDIRLERLFERPEEELDARKEEGELNTGEELADLNLYYQLVLARPDSVRAARLIDQLNALDVVEIAYAQPISEPAQVDLPPETDNFTDNQGYLDAAPNGIDARFAWTHTGGRGTGVRIVDVEFGWNLTHEDLGPAFFNSGGVGSFVQHGTSVLGEIVGANNDYGVTGIVSEAAFGVSRVGINIAGAINNAAGQLRRGDVLLIEQQAQGPDSGLPCDATNNANNCGQFELIAVEYWQAEFDAIRSASALGIIVVEAAGNGSMNLDSVIYENRFNRSFRDSGAILVGAGLSNSRAPHIWTNSGSRVDMQGWGDSIMTLGANCPVVSEQCPGTGDTRVNGNDANQWYRNSFGGTSGASPIVVGAAASIQGIRAARGLPLLDGFQMRAFLRASGTPQPANTRQIGPLPNLRAAIDMLENAPTTLVANQVFTVHESDFDVNTFIDVQPGDKIVFSATGHIWAGVLFTGENGPEGWDNIENNPEFPLPGSHPFALLGRLGSKYFFVGQGIQRAQTEPGAVRRLFLRINDNVPGNGNGQFTCQVQVFRSPSNAAYITQQVPASMIVGQSYPVSVTMQNTGASTWHPGYLYRLGSQGPQDNMTWGIGRVELPGPVPPGATVTFNFTVTAPSTPGSYIFQWRMLQEFVQWFGAFSPELQIPVNTLNQHLSLNVVSNSRTNSSETITVFATNTTTGASVTATVSSNGAVLGQTGQQITYTHSVKVCEWDAELKKTFCWWSPLPPRTFVVTAPGYDAASFTR
jgi:hypothetical protein